MREKKKLYYLYSLFQIQIIMKRFIPLFLIAASLPLLLASCKDSDDTQPASYVGWAIGGNPTENQATILHSTNGGQTWTLQSDSTAHFRGDLAALWIFDKNTVITVGGNVTKSDPTILKTTDGGNSWTRLTGPNLGNYSYNDIAAIGTQKIWIVGQPGACFRSDDGGATWTQITIPAEYQQVALERIFVRDENNIWIGGDASPDDTYPLILKTIDGGETWSRVNPFAGLGMTFTLTGHVLGIKAYGNSIWAIGGPGRWMIRSGDNGATWSDITIELGLGDSNDLFLLGEEEAYVVEDYNAILYTNNGGTSWDTLSYNANNFYTGISIVSRNHIWITGCPFSKLNSYSAIIHSGNGGKSWVEQTPDVVKNNSEISLYKIKFIASN